MVLTQLLLVRPVLRQQRVRARQGLDDGERRELDALCVGASERGSLGVAG